MANQGALEGWAETFEVPAEIQGLDRHNEVAKLLAALTHEIRLMDRQLNEAHIPDDLRKRFVDQLAQAASVSNLPNQWHNIRSNYLGPEVRLSLKWFKYILPEEALHATTEDLVELEALLAELEKKVEVDGIPASLAAFVQKQVAAIRDALRQYPIGGPAALKRATRTMVADIHLDEDEIRQAAGGARHRLCNQHARGLAFCRWVAIGIGRVAMCSVDSHQQDRTDAPTGVGVQTGHPRHTVSARFRQRA